MCVRKFLIKDISDSAAVRSDKNDRGAISLDSLYKFGLFVFFPFQRPVHKNPKIDQNMSIITTRSTVIRAPRNVVLSDSPEKRGSYLKRRKESQDTTVALPPTEETVDKPKQMRHFNVTVGEMRVFCGAVVFLLDDFIVLPCSA